MDAEDRALFAAGLRQATEQHTGTPLDSAIADLGWHDALDEDARAAVELLFELQGKANATSAALDDVLARSLGVVSGAAIVLPPLGHSTPPAEAIDGRLRVRGVASGALRERGRAVLVWEDGTTQLAEVTAEQLDCRPVTGIDPRLGLLEVTADLPIGDLSAAPAPEPWHSAVAIGRVALSHELVGACRQMLALARAHALDREQFGRPIAGFQAIRHRLADAYVSVEAAQACVAAAWDEDTAMAAAIAKAVAGAAGATVRKQAQQVLGGMGYTTEHPLHNYVRRTLVLDQLLGAGRTLTRELGQELLTLGDAPALLPL
jgi:hypothetical protein